MGSPRHVRQFDTQSYRATVNAMSSRGEDVHEPGRKHLDQTGTIHPNVDIVGKKARVCHNAMVPGDKPETYLLPNGVSLPILNLFDGTASTAQWVKTFFLTAERQYKLLDGVRTRYNPQLATGVVNDIYNVTENGLPVVQVSQFESDERSAEQVRLLQPASMGNDTNAEDYDLGLFYPLSIDADFWNFYGLKGYLTLALDEIGKEEVTGDGVRRYLGQSVDISRLGTEVICHRLLEHWHLFILQVPTYTGQFAAHTRGWWTARVGSGRVIQVENPNLLAEVRASLVYITEALNPTKQGLVEFLRTGDRMIIDAADLDQVWQMVSKASEHFGAQAKLPGYHDIPHPNDVFAHFRHAWPIGHPRASENAPIEEAAAS